MQCPPDVHKRYSSNEIDVVAVEMPDQVQVTFIRNHPMYDDETNEGKIYDMNSTHIVQDNTLFKNMGNCRSSEFAALLEGKRHKIPKDNLEIWKENVRICDISKTRSSVRVVHAVIISMIDEIDWHRSQGISRLLSTSPNVAEYFNAFLESLKENRCSGLGSIASQVQEDFRHYQFYFVDGTVRIYPGVETSKSVIVQNEEKEDSGWTWFVLFVIGVLLLGILFFLWKTHKGS